MKRLLALFVLPLLFAAGAHAQSAPPLDPSTIPAAFTSAIAQYEASQGLAYAGDCQTVDSSSAGDSCSLTWQQSDGSFLTNLYTIQPDGTYPATAFDSTTIPAIGAPLPDAPAAQAAPSQAPAAASASAHTWYTSSASNATTYYCDDDPDWRTLSPRNLQSYPTVAALIAVYPNKHLHRPCLDGAVGP